MKPQRLDQIKHNEWQRRKYRLNLPHQGIQALCREGSTNILVTYTKTPRTHDKYSWITKMLSRGSHPRHVAHWVWRGDLNHSANRGLSNYTKSQYISQHLCKQLYSYSQLGRGNSTVVLLLSSRTSHRVGPMMKDSSRQFSKI